MWIFFCLFFYTLKKKNLLRNIIFCVFLDLHVKILMYNYSSIKKKQKTLHSSVLPEVLGDAVTKFDRNLT